MMRLIYKTGGRDSSLIENRTLPYKGRYSAEKYVGVNQRSPYYAYPGYATSLTIPGIYSKANPLLMVNNGFGIFYAQNANVQYDPPYTGGYSIDPLFWTECCNTEYTYYHRPGPIGIKDAKANNENLKIYPNPIKSGSVNIQFKNGGIHSGVIEVFDILGRKVVNKAFQTRDNIYKLKLDKNIIDGVYLFLIVDNKHQYQQKVVIQNN